MKTFKVIIITMMVTILGGTIGGTAYCVDQGIVTVEEKSTTHSKRVYIDDDLTEETFWSELIGYTVRFKADEQAYIGK